MARLQGRVAIVTGGAQGIGRACAIRLAQEGASVVIADLQHDKAAGVVTEIEAQGGRAMAVEIDVANHDQVEAMAETAVAQFGGIDILLNNAGVVPISPFLDITEAEWDRTFSINCKGLLWCSQAAARQMIVQGHGGKIINMASITGRKGGQFILTYSASKAAIISMTQSMALALAPHQITVNAIAPGIVDTPLWVANEERLSEVSGLPQGESMRRLAEAIPLGRIEQPEDVAGMAAFLASSDADYITQQTYNVDGGSCPG